METIGLKIDRWTVLALYRTQGGKLVGHKEWRSLVPGEHTKSGGTVAETEAHIIEFFW